LSDVDPHDEVQELLGAYALDAVDGDERERVEDHLRECARCRAEVAQHREVAAQLASTGADAPEGLWRRIAAELELEPGAASGDLAAILPLAPRPASRGPLVGIAAAAAAVVVAVGVLGWQVHHDADQIRRLRGSVAASGVGPAASAALADPAARVTVLSSTDGRVRLTAVVEPDGSGYLLHAGALPALPAGETYQLWAVSGAARISLGVLGGRPETVAFHAGGSGVGALAITAEHGGGAVQPTGTPLVTGTLPAV